MKTILALILLVSLSTLAQAQQNGWRYERLRPSGDIVENRYSPIGLSREKGAPMPLAEGSWDTIFNKPNYDKLLDNGYVFAMASDGDKLYISGGFEYFNGIQCFNIIQYDRTTDQWSPLG